MRIHVAFTVVLLVGVLPLCLGGQSQSTSAKVSQQSAAAKSSQPAMEYVNKEYGFRIELPPSWKGYTVVREEWSGGNGSDGKVFERGPILVVRNPRWTDDRPTQDIPIMVFTLAQWKRIENDELFVSAAPIGPGELGRNRKHVFALPARFTNADVDEQEEVVELIRRNPLKAF